jgi:hypothetical protein
LQYDQPILQPALPYRTGCAPSFSEKVSHGRAGSLPRGKDAEHEDREDCCESAESKHPTVHGDVTHARQRRWGQGAQHSHADDCDAETPSGRGETQHRGFHDELAREAKSRGPKCQSNSNLTLTRKASDEEKIGQRRGADQQDTSRGGEKRDERGPHVSDPLIQKRFGDDGPARIRSLRNTSCDNCVELSSSLFRCGVRSQSTIHDKIVFAIELVFGREAEADPELLLARPSTWHDAYNREWVIVDGEDLSKDRGRSPES